MAFKVIAVGNIIMGDDGIGIRVLEKIQKQLERMGIECIIGETDFEYCISRIEDGDFIIIIDAACCGNNVGEITIVPIQEFNLINHGISQHGACLLSLLPLSLNIIKGYIIGIEINNIEFSTQLTKEISEKLNYISINVKDNIERLGKLR